MNTDEMFALAPHNHLKVTFVDNTWTDKLSLAALGLLVFLKAHPSVMTLDQILAARGDEGVEAMVVELIEAGVLL